MSAHAKIENDAVHAYTLVPREQAGIFIFREQATALCKTTCHVPLLTVAREPLCSLTIHYLRECALCLTGIFLSEAAEGDTFEQRELRCSFLPKHAANIELERATESLSTS